MQWWEMLLGFGFLAFWVYIFVYELFISTIIDNYKYKKGVDVKMTFRQLFQGSYLPFTFAEFLGKDPVEETRCEFSLTKEALTCEELAKGSVNCNYGISDVYITLKDERGEIAFQRVIRTIQADVRSVQWSGEIPVTELAPLTGKRLSVEIVCQLSTGERPLIYRGILS